jgi:hypothetical protein
MQKHIARISLIIFCAVISACSKSESVPKESATKATATKASATRPSSSTSNTASTTASSVPASWGEEPPESVLRVLMVQQYAALDKAGGLPVTVTATGYSGNLRSKLYSVEKDQCNPSPHGPVGKYDCVVKLMITLWFDGKTEPTKPSEDNKRLSAMKNAKGEWIDCHFNSGIDGICYPTSQ